MRRSGPRSCTLGRVAAFAILAFLGGCKPHAGVSAPQEGPALGDVADIEAELERNADELAAEGIYVARAGNRPPQPVTQQEPESTPSRDAGSEDLDMAQKRRNPGTKGRSVS